MDAEHKKAKRARASKPKVKSGCVTCKIRRVKCDETKPGCLRCQKFGRPCDGYASKETTSGRSLTPIAIQPKPGSPPPTLLFHSSVSPTPMPTLLPRHSVQSSPLQVSHSHCSTSSTRSCSISTSAAGDDKEHRYYQLFCERMAPDLGGDVPTEFWRRLVSQERHAEPSIEHAIVALTPLIKAANERVLETSNIMAPTYSTSEQYNFALRQYNKAIVCLRRILLLRAEPQTSTALVSCLLFVCLENYQGNYDKAAEHMQCCLGLLEQWQTDNPQSTAIDISCPSSPTSHLDEEVIQMFARLDANAFDHNNSDEPALDYPDIELLFPPPTSHGIYIPVTFSDAEEARTCWDLLMNKALRYHRGSATFRYSPSSEPRPLWVEEERNACIALLQQFKAAIEPMMLLSEHCGSPPMDGFLFDSGPTMLYVSAKVSLIYLEALGYSGELRYDLYAEDFAEIVSRSCALVEDARATGDIGPGAFAFETGIVPPLHLTAMKCRDLNIRRKAITLLLSCPRREGSWDGVLLGKVDTWLMSLEEEGMDEYGYVPETSRWRLSEVKSNLVERWIWVKAVRDTCVDGVWIYGASSEETRLVW